MFIHLGKDSRKGEKVAIGRRGLVSVGAQPKSGSRHGEETLRTQQQGSAQWKGDGNEFRNA